MAQVPAPSNPEVSGRSTAKGFLSFWVRELTVRPSQGAFLATLPPGLQAGRVPSPPALGTTSPESSPLSCLLSLSPPPSPGHQAPEAEAATTTSLEAAALATTDATLPGPSLTSLTSASSAVPSEPARSRSPCWRAAMPPAPSVLPLWPRAFLLSWPSPAFGPGPRLAAEHGWPGPFTGQSSLGWESGRFGPMGLCSCHRASLGVADS